MMSWHSPVLVPGFHHPSHWPCPAWLSESQGLAGFTRMSTALSPACGSPTTPASPGSIGRDNFSIYRTHQPDSSDAAGLGTVPAQPHMGTVALCGPWALPSLATARAAQSPRRGHSVDVLKGHRAKPRVGLGVPIKRVASPNGQAQHSSKGCPEMSHTPGGGREGC